MCFLWKYSNWEGHKYISWYLRTIRELQAYLPHSFCENGSIFAEPNESEPGVQHNQQGRSPRHGISAYLLKQRRQHLKELLFFINAWITEEVIFTYRRISLQGWSPVPSTTCLEDRELSPTDGLLGERRNPSSLPWPPPSEVVPSAPTAQAIRGFSPSPDAGEGLCVSTAARDDPSPAPTPVGPQCSRARWAGSQTSAWIPPCFGPFWTPVYNQYHSDRKLLQNREKKTFETTPVHNKPSQMPVYFAGFWSSLDFVLIGGKGF